MNYTSKQSVMYIICCLVSKPINFFSFFHKIRLLCYLTYLQIILTVFRIWSHIYLALLDLYPVALVSTIHYQQYQHCYSHYCFEMLLYIPKSRRDPDPHGSIWILIDLAPWIGGSVLLDYGSGSCSILQWFFNFFAYYLL